MDSMREDRGQARRARGGADAHATLWRRCWGLLLSVVAAIVTRAETLDHTRAPMESELWVLRDWGFGCMIDEVGKRSDTQGV